MFSSQSTQWNTPEALFNALKDEFDFTLDPCPSNPLIDGLSIQWEETTFINPPYKRGIIDKWIKKAYESALNGFTMILLIPARTDTAFWHNYVMKASEIRLIKGRLHFSGHKTGAPFPSAIVIFKGGERQCNPRVLPADKLGRVISTRAL